MADDRHKKISVLYASGRELQVNEEFSSYLGKLLNADLSKQTWDGMVSVPEFSVDEELKALLETVVQRDRVSFDPQVRLQHSIGKSSPEIARAMVYQLPTPVDAVVFPNDKELRRLITVLKKENVRISIYGGGSSVTGGIRSKKYERAVCIDTSNLNDMEIGKGYCIAGSGLVGSEAERRLNAKGLTLGFFPESLEHSTIGGWISTKASGQESNAYGDIEDIVIAVDLYRSDSTVIEGNCTRISSGVDGKDIATGGEGRNGIVVRARLKTFPLPAKRYFQSFLLPSFESGIDLMKTMERFPDVMRLMDETETDLALNEAGDSLSKRILQRMMKSKGISRGSMVIIMSREKIAIPRVQGSIKMGQSPAVRWNETRYQRPYLGNMLWKRSVVVDTLETSASWNDLAALYRNVKNEFALVTKEIGVSGLIMSHISHEYQSGACIYFTFMFRSTNPVEDLDTIRDHIVQTFISSGGSITHHHGIGNEFRKYLSDGLKSIQDRVSDPVFLQV
ncbi:MAG: FAD-binding oxidoreductase [Thermoplasmata archaeon]